MFDENKIPKRIWFFWQQGMSDAPLVVRKCHDSWKYHNPEWDFTLLDNDNIVEYIDLEAILKENYSTITIQALSDIIRINLLSKFGGVWVDATCYCCKPLDSWLGGYSKTGFFAFDLFKPGKDRLISSWFMVSDEKNYLVEKYKKAVNAYWGNSLSKAESYHDHGYIYSFLTFNVYWTRFWFFPVFIKIFDIYPYFWFHYIFTEIIRKDSQCRQIWNDTKKYSAEIPCGLLRAGLHSKLSSSLKNELDNKKAPLYKLSWKGRVGGDVDSDSILGYLLYSS